MRNYIWAHSPQEDDDCEDLYRRDEARREAAQDEAYRRAFLLGRPVSVGAPNPFYGEPGSGRRGSTQ